MCVGRGRHKLSEDKNHFAHTNLTSMVFVTERRRKGQMEGKEMPDIRAPLVVLVEYTFLRSLGCLAGLQ